MEGLTELAYKRMYKKYKTDFINEFRKDPRFEDGSLVWSDEYAKENFKAHMEIREKVFDSFPEEVKSNLNNKDCILIGYCSTKEKTILSIPLAALPTSISILFLISIYCCFFFCRIS